ncbi:MAG: serine/threonine-protein kinase [Pseudonocardiaceae bacterium]
MVTERLISDHYRLIEQLPAIPPRVRWRARDEWSGRLVTAARVAMPGLAGSEILAARYRLAREVRAMEGRKHRHTVWLIDVVLDADDLWVISEPGPVTPLAEALAERGRVEPEQAARWGRDIADGLAAAHGAGVPHRDLHSGVVFLTEDGTVVVDGFATTVISRRALRAGTPVHVAPEIAFGTDEPSPAADVFALGAVLYRAVEGHGPFPEDGDRATLLQTSAAGVVIVPRRTGPLTGLLMQMLHPDPTCRPSAGAVRDLLATASPGELPTVSTSGSHP